MVGALEKAVGDGDSSFAVAAEVYRSGLGTIGLADSPSCRIIIRRHQNSEQLMLLRTVEAR